MTVIHAANNRKVETRLYDSVDKIEKAGISKDDQLCVFFEKYSTDSTKSHFAVVIPLSQIRTNAGVQTGFTTAGIMRTTNSDDLYLRLVRDKGNPLFVRCTITSATLHVPGSTIQTNWALLENQKINLKSIPIGEPLIVRPNDNAAYHGLSLTLLSNATETVYLTRTEPIEFAYIDASIKRSLTIVTVDPYIVSTKRTEHPGYYCFLPLTVPVDIATFPIQAVCYGFVYWMFSGLGRNC